MARFSTADYEYQRSSSTADRVTFFGLKGDGDEAIVRFAYTSPDELEVFTVHNVKVGNAYRKVNCLRGPKESVDKCPLCKSGNNIQYKMLVKLIEYVTDERGVVTLVPRVWERPTSFISVLRSIYEEYGDISSAIFKVKRHGERGSLQTSYDVLFANPAIYKPEVFVKDFSGFDNYSPLGYNILDKSVEDMETYLQTGNFPLRTVSREETNTETPHSAQGVYGKYNEGLIPTAQEGLKKYSEPSQYGESNQTTDFTKAIPSNVPTNSPHMVNTEATPRMSTDVPTQFRRPVNNPTPSTQTVPPQQGPRRYTY